MKFYDKIGYVDIREIQKSCPVPFVFIIGGRGTGKTYTALKTARDDGETVLIMRRTATQLETISKEIMNPYKSLAINEGFSYHCEPIAKNVTAVFEDPEEGKPKLLAYMTALSTVSNLRGFDASDVTEVIFDEFIAENHERPIKNEADAFFNAYETINRNREIQGRPPVKCLFLANANRLDTPIFAALGIVKKVQQMQKNKQIYTVDEARGFAVVLLQDSPISEKKALTALYKLTAGKFADMALANDFAYDDLSDVRSVALAEFDPIAKISDIYIYRHKTKREYYATRYGKGSPPEYSDSPQDRRRFRQDFPAIGYVLILSNFSFESYDIKQYLLELLRI